MRQGQNKQRSRNRGGRKPGQGFSPNRSMDSNGPDVKVRGTAQTIYEKYQQLARDAHSSGDRVNAENYLQHAEHYYRLIQAMQAALQQQQQNRAPQNNQDNNGAEEGANNVQSEQPAMENAGNASNGNAPARAVAEEVKSPDAERPVEQAAPIAEAAPVVEAVAPAKPPRKKRTPKPKAKPVEVVDDASGQSADDAAPEPAAAE